MKGTIAEYALGGMFPEKQCLDIVKSHAKCGAIAIAIPFVPILDAVLYVFVLWHMYHKLSKTVGKSLSITLGVFVNILVTIGISLADEALDWIPLVGWAISAFVVYLQFYFSGKAYISFLKG